MGPFSLSQFVRHKLSSFLFTNDCKSSLLGPLSRLRPRDHGRLWNLHQYTGLLLLATRDVDVNDFMVGRIGILRPSRRETLVGPGRYLSVVVSPLRLCGRSWQTVVFCYRICTLLPQIEQNLHIVLTPTGRDESQHSRQSVRSYGEFLIYGLRHDCTIDLRTY